MVSEITNSQGATALDVQQLLNWLRGDTIVSGCAPTAGSGSREIDVASGTARVSGTNVAVGSGTATLDAGDSSPRKDLVYIDSNGAIQVAKGTAAAAAPSGSTRFNTFNPAPPDTSGITGAVVAEVWVAAGKSGTFASADINDRRVLSALDLDLITTGSAVIGSGDTINQVEYGNVDIDVGASASSTTDTQATASSSVTFTTTFGSSPDVVCSIEHLNNLVLARPQTITTTGFDIVVTNFSSNDPGSQTVHWVAIG